MRFLSFTRIVSLFSFWLLILPGFLYRVESVSAENELPTFRQVIEKAKIGDPGPMGQSAAWSDFNGDGCLDLIVTNTKKGKFQHTSLFKNNCDGTFSDITKTSGINNERLRSVSWGDYNNDGLTDLVVGTIRGGDTPILYQNLGGGNFKDVTKESGINRGGAILFNILWGDYDNDGFLDLLQVNRDGGSFLYRNKGDGTFRDVSDILGLGPEIHSSSAAFFDYNNDGLQDLFFANSEVNRFFLNEGNGKFVDMTEKAGLAGDKNWNSVSVCPGDFDNDGLIDIYVGNIKSNRNALYKNNGDGTFSDVTEKTGTGDAGDARTCGWVDFDGDGWIDLLSTNHVRENKFYRNRGGKNFEDVAESVGILKPMDVFAATWGDYNGDGFMDVFFTGHLGHALMLNSGNSNNVLIVDLAGDGKTSNRSAIGARVELETSGNKQIREVYGSMGANEQDMLPVQFGLGQEKKADIMVRWPSGKKCEFKDVDIKGSRKLKISETDCRLE